MEWPQNAYVVVERQHDKMARSGYYSPQAERLQAQNGAHIH